MYLLIRERILQVVIRWPANQHFVVTPRKTSLSSACFIHYFSQFSAIFTGSFTRKHVSQKLVTVTFVSVTFVSVTFVTVTFVSVTSVSVTFVTVTFVSVTFVSVTFVSVTFVSVNYMAVKLRGLSSILVLFVI